jgi:hypothetical protein
MTPEDIATLASPYNNGRRSPLPPLYSSGWHWLPPCPPRYGLGCRRCPLCHSKSTYTPYLTHSPLPKASAPQPRLHPPERAPTLIPLSGQAHPLRHPQPHLHGRHLPRALPAGRPRRPLHHRRARLVGALPPPGCRRGRRGAAIRGRGRAGGDHGDGRISRRGARSYAGPLRLRRANRSRGTRRNVPRHPLLLASPVSPLPSPPPRSPLPCVGRLRGTSRAHHGAAAASRHCLGAKQPSGSSQQQKEARIYGQRLDLAAPPQTQVRPAALLFFGPSEIRIVRVRGCIVASLIPISELMTISISTMYAFEILGAGESSRSSTRGARGEL